MFEIAEAPRLAECKICYKDIKKGELRIKANLGSGNYAYCYHLNCFLETYKDTIEEMFDFYLKKFNPSKKKGM